MCGIAGLWRQNGRDPGDGVRIERMADSIVHRGPDDFGYLLAESSSGRTQVGKRLVADFTPDLLLAARRLAITDLTPAGAQPIANEDGTIVVVFNGAIHNFVELRAELETRGHRFRSHTDTEVIVHAYEEWGADCARRFNGMWAYVIWDARERRLVLSRDRFGVKPLYITQSGRTFYFASEIKAILASGEVPVRPNFPFLRRFFDRRPPVEDVDSAFAGIESVPAGYNVVVTRDSIARARYWTYKDQSERYDYARPEETFRELLSESVRIRLRADVPIGLLLSGGFDSTAIGGEVARHHPQSGQAFTASFPGFRKDETAYARAAADHYGLQLHTVEYDPSRLLDDLTALTWFLESPPGRAQMIPRWQLLEAVARNVPVVLEGQGGDELYGGYDPHFRAAARSEGRRAPPPGLLASLARAARAYLAARKDARRKRRHPAKASAWQDIASPDIPKKTAQGIYLPDIDFGDDVNNTLAFDHAQRTLPYLLHMGDAISMAHSVEARFPMLDHRLVEFTFRLPGDRKIRHGQPKEILRTSLALELPPAILQRRNKIGFATPIAEWLAPRFESTIKPMLQSSAARSRGIFEARSLDRFLDGYRPTGKMSFLLLEALAIETWFQVFVDGKRPAQPTAGRARRSARTESVD